MDKNKTLRIGLMGGTFDPIHYGHLVTAESARVKYHLDKVIFVPTGNPPHKKGKKVSPSANRLIMTSLATATNVYFEVSTVEVDRPGFSYAYDTVSYFDDYYQGTAEIYFITGADAILDILTWKNVYQVAEKCFFIAASRPGFHLTELDNLPQEITDKIVPMEIPALAISSTDIRQRVATHDSIKYLLPESVEKYIYKIKLYL